MQEHKPEPKAASVYSQGHTWGVVKDYDAEDAKYAWPHVSAAAALDHAYIQALEMFAENAISKAKDGYTMQSLQKQLKSLRDNHRNNY